MACSHCRSLKPGAIVRVYADGKYSHHCIYCGDLVGPEKMVINGGRDRWDTYFHKICKAVSSKSPCLSRQIGAIIVRDRSVVSTGYNGPPRHYPHCKPIDGKCPRHARGCKSGEDLVNCPATHAEANAIANAAKLGVSVADCHLYLNTIIPCKDCMSLIINAGIKRIICEEMIPYHKMSLKMAIEAKIEIVEFQLIPEGDTNEESSNPGH